VALALCAFLGVFGAHRFYVGKAGTGILQLVTFGGLGIWMVYDLILVASGSFRDFEGRRVLEWGPEGSVSPRLLGEEVMEELDLLRTEMAEMQERLDFTERMLTQGTATPGDDTTQDSHPAVTPH